MLRAKPLVTAVIACLAGLPASAETPKEVIVTNDASAPVPVTIENGPVTITNTEVNPVPVVSVARQPYQLFYAMTASPGTVEECRPIPVPDGSALTITTIGVDVTVDPTETPDVYLRVGHFSNLVRYRGALHLVRQSSTDRYKGIYTLSVSVGETDSGDAYSAGICVHAPPGGTEHGSSARGTVSGYVEAATIIDGNALP
ncbi:MAG: hypothetical protein PVF51_14620 [Nitrospirota bacterium]